MEGIVMESVWVAVGFVFSWCSSGKRREARYRPCLTSGRENPRRTR